MSLTLEQQLAKHIEDPEGYNNVFPHKNWTMSQYREMFEYIGEGWLVQSSDSCGFIVNPEWEGEPMWEPEEELVDCDFCGVKEDPDEIIKGTEGKACGSCRHLCDKEEEEEKKCWTCDVSVATHKTYRDALGEFELTCDKCHREEYPEEKEEREYTIEKQVCGMGYMSFYDEKDMLEQIVYSKNGCWKLKGDKTSKDLEGELCITDDEEEEEIPWCFENSTKDTIENDSCFCSVGSCALPTFDDSDEEEE